MKLTIRQALNQIQEIQAKIVLKRQEIRSAIISHKDNNGVNSPSLLSLKITSLLQDIVSYQNRIEKILHVVIDTMIKESIEISGINKTLFSWEVVELDIKDHISLLKEVSKFLNQYNTLDGPVLDEIIKINENIDAYLDAKPYLDLLTVEVE